MTERTQFIVANMEDAIAQRLFATVTVWNRLEGRPRTANFNRALKAEVRDALWMLTRQWQLGEFRGDDAGSPISAKIRVTTSRLRKYRPGEMGAVEPFDETLPLETKVERRPVPFTLDMRLLMGRQFLKMMPFADLRQAFIDRYPIHQPDPTAKADFAVCAHPEAWSEFAANAGRRMDGAALYQHLGSGGAASDGIAGVAGRESDLAGVAARFVAWFEKLVTQPGADDAWNPSRLEYRFACSAPAQKGEKVLDAEEYYQGHLDWYSVDIDPGKTLDDPLPPEAGNPASKKQVVIPTTVTFNGMPNTRWWAFEDGTTNFGDIKPDTTDLAKLLLIEFGLIFANDWFLVPYVLPAGTIAHVDGVAVKNVFGERTWVEPAGRGLDDDWQRWAMYLVNIKGKTFDFADTSLLLLPVAAKVDESRPFEEVMLLRDEVANMVWGIEKIIPLPTGEPKQGVEAARELRAFYEQDVVRRLGPPPAAVPTAPSAVVRYELMNSVPENWIPFIPVHLDGDIRSIQLQRAAMLRILDGDDQTPRKVEPRSVLLRQGLDQKQTYFIHEEEVPRAGIVVKQSYQRTRWRDGRAWVWIGARKQTGRGEGHSGLAFDRAIEVPPKK
jgi:hypothetical protein